MAGVIKSGQVHEGPGVAQVAVFNFEDMSRKANAYLETVRQQAAQILVQARQQAAAIEQQAREQGHQAAVQQAAATAQAHVDRQLQSLLPALNKSVESIRQSRQSWLKHWEKNTVQLATAVAEKVIRRQLSATPEISLDWIREALELVTGEGRVTVRLHPQDFATLGKRVDQLTERLAPLGRCQVLADPQIDLGGCRVDTEFGCVDQQVQVQLERIEQELVGDLNSP